MATIYKLHTRDKPRLLFAMMRALAGESSKLSLEGTLSQSELTKVEGASPEESGALKRGTLQPKLDFFIFPLTQRNAPAIEKAIRSRVGFKGYGGIIHAQIEVSGKLAFAAYDHFHPDCVTLFAEVPPKLLDELVKQSVLRKYERAEIDQGG